MIVDITNELYTELKSTIQDATVLPNYPSTPPTMPCIIFYELSNNEFEDTVNSSGAMHCEISFQADIFSDSEDKVSIAKGLRKKIDTILGDKYRMKREYSGEIPNFLDSNIYRYTLRYSCVVDENKTIYRR